ncbi:MAG: gamma-glutamyltransferase, partial [Gammaproteobacteria bacterium]|nr:gamma-glutamyltransferase [Gammaproteobacteria bacterium]
MSGGSVNFFKAQCRTRRSWWLLLLLSCCGPALAGDQSPAAAVASSNLLSTRAGVEIIKRGGNAFDAAVAVTAVLAVVEPYSSGLGGGGLWLLYRARDGKQVLIDGRERAPQLAHWHLYRQAAEKQKNGVANETVLNAAIPGIPAGIVHLAQQYGRLPLSINLKPAINLAKKGFYTNDVYRQAVAARLSDLLQYPDSAKIFLDHGQVPRSGYWLKQKDLAITLTTLAREGQAGFYQGAVAGQLVHEVNNHGGIWTAKDLLSYQIRERDPLVFT